MTKTQRRLLLLLVTQHVPIQFLSLPFRRAGAHCIDSSFFFFSFNFFCFDDLPLESIVD